MCYLGFIGFVMDEIGGVCIEFLQCSLYFVLSKKCGLIQFIVLFFKKVLSGFFNSNVLGKHQSRRAGVSEE